MKTVFLAVGPQGVGKSTFCEKFLRFNPQAVLISRDAILIELYGTVYLDGYSGGHYYAMEELLNRTEKQLKKNEDALIILDCWTGSSRERDVLNYKLRSFGAEQIIAWYFVTPEAVALDWFMKREEVGILKNAKDNLSWAQTLRESKHRGFIHDYRLYHSYPVDCDQGFDCVVEIDPRQLLLLDLFPNFYVG